jgi:hypothetical protein
MEIEKNQYLEAREIENERKYFGDIMKTDREKVHFS